MVDVAYSLQYDLVGRTVIPPLTKQDFLALII